MHISPIAIDLGGKNTGFFSFTGTLDNSQSGTVIYDDSFVLSQVGRRGKRHSKRNNARNKLVKRLFLLILQKHYGLAIDTLPDEIRGLFNKRGYTYAGFELDEKKKEALEGDTLKEFLSDKLQNIDKDSDTETFLNQVASNGDSFKNYKVGFDKLFADSTHSPNKKTALKDEVKNEYFDGANELLAGLRVVKELLDEFDKQENQGNLPRAKYFEEIGEYITTNEKVKSFFDSNSLKLQDMTKLIGNISNYQLKELRRYFNDKEMEKGDIWAPDKLHRITERFVRSWHPKSDADRQRRAELMRALKSKEIMELLTTTDPVMTIPPYDDMNNRGAVKCQTLRLNEEYLGKHLSNWRDIANRLNHGKFNDDLADSTVKGYSKDSTLLHRLLDTTKEIDIYELRGREPNDLLVKMLGQSDANRLHGFAQNYYELIRQKVRVGIWTSPDGMLKRCDHNPPHKTNQVHNLVAGILGVKLDEAKFAEFEKELWSAKVGSKKLSAYCKNIEELRKTHGNLFKQIVEAGEDKDAVKYQEGLEFWTTKIAEFFGIDNERKQRFNNLFSMAQLHTVIDTPRSGFSSTCKWCTAENRFRSETAFYNDETGEFHKKATATCQRLPADTQRPFSGKIERYIDKLGFELAKIKANELEGLEAQNIHLPIILEQNAFEYEESIRSAKIKNANKKANEKLDKALKNNQKSLDAKIDRIKAFSGGVCPYCGEMLGDDGEIDHILPRSHTLKYYGTVFNSEGNLIYVHQKCNQAKADRVYKLSDIKAGVSAQWIEEQVANIKGYKTFSVLSAEQQKAFRYALFLPNDNEAYKKVAEWLRTDQSARVNGTQKYLAKKIQEKLIKILPNKHLSFEFILADATEVSELRRQYARQNPLLEKQNKQAPSSHAIDAVMSFVARYQKVFSGGTPPNADDVVKLAMLDSWNPVSNEPLTKGLSTNQKIEKMIKSGDYGQKNMREVFGKSIFKDEAIGERYKPIVTDGDKIYIGYPKKISGGYDLHYCHEATSKKEREQINSILASKYARLAKDEQNKKLYEIDKKAVSEASNILFGSAYSDLNDLQKMEATLVEAIINNCKYYVKKTEVVNAPQFVAKTDMRAYPLYDDWVRFDNAWKAQIKDGYKEKLEQGKKIYDILQVTDEWIEFCKSYFGITKNDIRYKARKTFSLIALTSAPGTVFRLKRKTHRKDDFVYQAIAIDNQQISGDYVNILLKNGKQTIALAGQNPSSSLKKEISVKETKEIRSVVIDPKILFRDDFDVNGIDVILNKTSATIKNFPISKVKDFLLGSEKRFALLYISGQKIKKSKNRSKPKTTLDLLSKNKQANKLCVKKDAIDAILKLSTRDGSVSQIAIQDGVIDFVLPFKSTQKLLK